MAKKFTDEFLMAQGRILYDQASVWVDERIKPQMEKDNDQYNGIFRNKQNSDVLKTKKLFIPKTYSTVDRLLVDMIEGVLADMEEIVDISSWKTVPTVTRELAKTLMHYRLNGNPINFFQEFYEFAQDCLKNSRGIFKVYPKFFNGIYDPKIDCIPLEDVFFHPHATWKNYWKFPIIHRMRKTLDEMKRGDHKNLEEFEKYPNPVAVDMIKIQREQETGSPFIQQNREKRQNQAYLYEIWDFLDIDGTGLLESVVYSMGGDESGPAFITKGVEKNDLPYKFRGDDYNRPPIIMGYVLPDAHKQKGKSVPEIMGGLQREINAIRNQRREAVALALRQPILVNRGAGIDLIAAVNRKIGSVIMGDDISPSAVRELEVSGPDTNSILDMERTDADTAELTSIPPDLQGAATLRDDTATGVSSRVNNANKKIRKMLLTVINTGVIPAMKFLLRLEQAYESSEFIEIMAARQGLTTQDPDGNPLTLSDAFGVSAADIIQGEFDLKVKIGLNKDAQLNKLFLLMDRLNQQNTVTAQFLQLGIVDPKHIHMMSTMPIAHRVMGILGEKNLSEFMIPLSRPENPGAQSPGVASQPREGAGNNGPGQLTGV